MFDTLYHFVNNHPYIIFILFTGICLLQYKYKITGFIFSLIAFLFGFLLYYTDNYSYSVLIKCYLVLIAAFIFFYKLNFNWKVNVNYLLSLLLAMNVFVLIFTVMKNQFVNNHITDYFLVFCFLLVTISTPLAKVSKNNAKLSKIFTNVNLYIILYTLTLAYYFMINPNFYEHFYLHMFAIILPFLSHFINNKWMETRALCLCLIFIYDILDKKNYAL